MLATLKGHTKRITRVAVSGASDAPIGSEAASDEAALPSYVVSASEDGKVKVWTPTGATGAKAQAYAVAHNGSPHRAKLRGWTCIRLERCWQRGPRRYVELRSLDDGSELFRVDAGLGDAYESFAFHPDGQLAATGLPRRDPYLGHQDGTECVDAADRAVWARHRAALQRERLLPRCGQRPGQGGRGVGTCASSPRRKDDCGGRR